jgi:hypothetical protein
MPTVNLSSIHRPLAPGRYRVVSRPGEVPPGLHIVAEEGGARRWTLRFTLAGKEQKRRIMVLFPLPEVRPKGQKALARRRRATLPELLLVPRGALPLSLRLRSN